MERLLSTTRDTSLLNSAFQRFLDMEDVRYYVMSAVRENVATVMTRNRGVGGLSSSPSLLLSSAVSSSSSS